MRIPDWLGDAALCVCFAVMVGLACAGYAGAGGVAGLLAMIVLLDCRA